MITILLMCGGIAAGKFLFKKEFSRYNGKLQTLLTLILIFLMGVTIGKNEDLKSNISVIGFDSLIFCLIPSICSVILVYIVTRKR